MMNKRSFVFAALILLTGALRADAQVVGPPKPKEYRVQFRYRINAGRNERIVQFFALLDFLRSVGFQRDPGPEDEPENAAYNRMSGKIAAANVRRLLEDPHIKSLLLFPPNYKIPELEDQKEPVKVHIALASGLPATQQRLLHEQTRDRLGEFGFKESIAYDHRGYTVLMGYLPTGELQTMLFDLRTEPSGWLAPVQPVRSLPGPLAEVSPLLITEVIPEPDGVPPIKELPPVAEVPAKDAYLMKITPEVRALKEEDAAKATRLEVILAVTPNPDNENWTKEIINVVPTAQIEGRLGEIVTVLMAPKDAAELAASPIISTIRLPRSGAPIAQPTVEAKGANRAVLDQTGLARLHALGHRGRGVRVAVIASDFRGADELLKARKLPSNTKLLDLTRQLTPRLEAAPYPEDGIKQGYGTECALAVAVAAPQAELLLIRVEASSPYQILQIAQFINNEPPYLASMVQRREDLDAGFEDLQKRWKALMMDRKELFDDFSSEDEAVKKREAHFAKVKELKDEDALYRSRLERFVQTQRDLRDLTRLQVVVNTLSWPEGHSVDGSSPLTRYLNNNPFRSTIWFQTAGDTRDQVWTGYYRDTDANEVLEFASPEAPLRKGRWSHELNFLGWRPFKDKDEPELPEKATLRFSLQWRETHDPQFLKNGEDLYREPLAQVQMQLLKQRDPTGMKLGTDDMELVARSFGLPQRIDNHPSYATYVQTMEYTVEAPARFALRLLGRPPVGIRPPSVPSVPAVRKDFDLRMRVFVEVLDANNRSLGRAVFIDYPTNEGSIGMPGDSQALLTTGAVNRSNRMEIFSALGPPMGLELLPKPNLFGYNGLELAAEDPRGVRGTSIAASFAAGFAASTLSAGMQPEEFRQPQGMRTDVLLKVPANLPAQSAPKR